MGWEALGAILGERRRFREDSEQAEPVECPNDGEALRPGHDGRPYCPFDGWRPDR